MYKNRRLGPLILFFYVVPYETSANQLSYKIIDNMIFFFFELWLFSFLGLENVCFIISSLVF